MTWVTLGIGSAENPAEQIESCLDALLLHFRDMSLSSVFESEPVDTCGNNFLNMVVGFDTELELTELGALLREIERKLGRDRMSVKDTSKMMDIDILTFGKLAGKHDGFSLPRPGVTENAYVLWPLSQINGKRKHPGTGQTYQALWEAYDKASQKLWPVDFNWHGRMISRR